MKVRVVITAASAERFEKLLAEARELVRLGADRPQGIDAGISDTVMNSTLTVVVTQGAP